MAHAEHHKSPGEEFIGFNNRLMFVLGVVGLLAGNIGITAFALVEYISVKAINALGKAVERKFPVAAGGGSAAPAHH